MQTNDIVLLKSREVTALLEGRENEIVEQVARAYLTHAQVNSSLPHSTFLRFPQSPRNRIIALPAYLGGEFEVAGIKWIGSFPGNLESRLERASAVIILNSPFTGKPEAILEGSVISAKRTAASAALAAKSLRSDTGEQSAALIGCGLINFEIARFLLATCQEINRLSVFDISDERAARFKERCEATFESVEIIIAKDLETALRSSSLISIATTSLEPYISDLSACRPGTTILHVSLRDLTPELIISCDNIVDDVDHVCRAQTSVHLAEQLVGDRDFIRGTLADVLCGKIDARSRPDSTLVFSPFGLGILDLALAQFVSRSALKNGQGTTVESFLPDSWAVQEQD